MTVTEVKEGKTVYTFGVEKLFVYGIFLGNTMRKAYNMKNPRYATVPGYVTVGDYIVKAHNVDDKRIALTGLLVDVDPVDWGRIDALESGYDRVRVQTCTKENAYMYVAKGEK